MKKKREEILNDERFKLTKFKVFQIILFLYNFWSLIVMTVMGYLSNLYIKGGYENPEVVRSGVYNFLSLVFGWYVNSYTLILTYMICSAILVFSVYTYILQKLKKARGLFLRPGLVYLSIMTAVSAFTILSLMNLIF